MVSELDKQRSPEVLAYIKSFIRVRLVDNTVHIDYDSMCKFLLDNCRRMFSPSQLERVLAVEVKKLEGLPICPELFDELARYINDMTLYMHQKGEKLGEDRTKTLAERFRKYTESLSRK